MTDVKAQKPFSKEYVINITKRNIVRAIELSFKMSAERVQEFEGNHDKSHELFVTMSELQGMKKQVKALFNITEA